MDATFAPKSGLAESAERRARIELVKRVAPHDAGAQILRDVHVLASFVGPDARGKPVRRVVCLLDRFFGRSERKNGKDWSENLLTGDPVRLLDVREETSREEISAFGQLARLL